MKFHLMGLIMLLSALTVSGKENGSPIKRGIWLAQILRTDSNTINFNFVSSVNKGKISLTILNADEKLLVDDIRQVKDSLYIKLPFFSASLVARIVNPQLLEGSYIKSYGDKKQIIPFKAVFGIKDRYTAFAKPAHSVHGTWDVLFEDRKGPASKAVGNFIQTADGKVKGSFLTPTGDYRYLEGIVSGDSLKLSGFDGGFASYFTAIIENDSTLQSGIFYSGATSHRKWSAVKNDQAQLPDEFGYAHLRPGESSLNFKFKDTNGKWVSIKDSVYQGKVVIVQILGSWCPNCMDETSFLSDYYKKNKEKGVEMIGLAYERDDNFENSKAALHTFQQRFKVDYPFLITGVTPSDPLKAEKTLPQIDRIYAFPTSIFIDKKGNVRKIHSGYDGPGTGKFYEAFKKEFNELVTELLNEPG